MTDTYLLGGTPIQLTVTIVGLASDANLLAGRQSTSVTFADNVVGFRLSGFVKTGSGAPTSGRAMHLFWVQKIGNNAAEASATWPSPFGDTDANVSVVSQAQAFAAGILLRSIEVTAATATTYSFSAEFTGEKFSRVGCLWVVHDWGQVPDTTAANHQIWLEPYTRVY